MTYNVFGGTLNLAQLNMCTNMLLSLLTFAQPCTLGLSQSGTFCLDHNTSHYISFILL